MTEHITLPIPKELEHPFFFSDNKKIIVEPTSLTNINISITFLYEAAFFSKINAIKPWEMHEEFIPFLLNEWENTKPLLEDFFSRRDIKQVEGPMKFGISLLIEFVYWVNEQPVQLSPAILQNNLSIKPVNLEERLSFILARPTLHHSYIQLSELMVEMEKQYVKQMALKKASKHSL